MGALESSTFYTEFSLNWKIDHAELQHFSYKKFISCLASENNELALLSQIRFCVQQVQIIDELCEVPIRIEIGICIT